MTYEFHKSPLGFIDWQNDELFYTHSWRDETSQFDTHPSKQWEHGGEYYSREYKCRMPIAFQHCEELQEKLIEWMIDNHNDADGFWVENNL